jgi:hypothetical protein
MIAAEGETVISATEGAVGGPMANMSECLTTSLSWVTCTGCIATSR